jgi:TolB-like protein/DNA-binding winged helix-turn-helix (wHTH) protein/Tfp pilus assembly protein PilF
MGNECNNLQEFGRCRLDIKNKVLWCEEKPVGLPLKAIELLCVLVGKGGEVATKDEIWNAVWQDSFVEETNLTHNIYLLRKTFRDLGEKNLIQNVPRRGYRFVGKLREISKGEIIIEKHTQTRTLIEIEEEKSEPSALAGGLKQYKEERFFIKSAVAAVLFLGLISVFGFFGYQNWRSGTSVSGIKSIAVLPFQTIDGGKESKYQGLGLTDVLITRLSNIEEINVRPTNAVLSFENHDPVEFGRKLKVDAVLEGSIYRTNEKVRVTVRLIKVGDNSPVWTGQFEKYLQDELRLQDEIALQVVNALALNLSGNEKNALTKRYTEDLDAFQLYVKGRYEWNKRSYAGTIDAQRLFRNAIERDPNFALAYVGLADSLALVEATETNNAIQNALELDPNLAEAHATLGFVKMFHKWQWNEAEESFKKSIELNPNYATAHHWYAELLAIEGRNDEAKAEMRRALEINPLSHNFLADLGQIYYFNREYKEAEEYCRKALEIYPEFAFAHQYLEAVYLKTGEYEKSVEARLAARKTFETIQNELAERAKEREANYHHERTIYLTGGIKKFIENSIDATQNSNNHYISAKQYAFLGEKEKALDFLEKANQGGGFLAAFIKADPIFDNLRDEPRYQEILRKINL